MTSADIPANPDPLSVAVGLEPGTRYRCRSCGNLTRFDVEVSERTVRFWHVGLSGVGAIEEEQVAERSIRRVNCRWCGSSEGIVVEPTPMQLEEGSTAAEDG